MLASWLDSRRAMGLDKPGLARRRARLWRRLQPTLARTPAFHSLAGRPLEDFPVTTPAQMRADYSSYNSLGLSDARLRAMADLAETGQGVPAQGLVAGYSTGTCGARGLFVTDEAERARYLGQSIARLLPATALITGARIALFLRANNALYSDVARGRSRFAYFPLHGALEERVRELKAFAPDILIAPSHILAGLARLEEKLPGLNRCFFGAEPMGAAERDWIAARLGARPDPIYQATEGFLGAACRFGRLHLNDHNLEIELRPVVGTAGFQPVVTDLCRTSQPIVRVLLDDFIEADDRACPCGFAGRTILPVQGRIGDLWRFGDAVLSPRAVTDVMEQALGPDAIWQAEASSTRVRVIVTACAPTPALAARLESDLQVPVPVEIMAGPVDPAFPKRRRVRWRTDA